MPRPFRYEHVAPRPRPSGCSAARAGSGSRSLRSRDTCTSIARSASLVIRARAPAPAAVRAATGWNGCSTSARSNANSPARQHHRPRRHAARSARPGRSAHAPTRHAPCEPGSPAPATGTRKRRSTASSRATSSPRLERLADSSRPRRSPAPRSGPTFVAPRRQHHDRQLLAHRTQPPTQRQPILARQHHVEHQHVRPLPLDAPLDVRTIRRAQHLELMLREIALQQFLQLDVVIDHQHPTTLRAHVHVHPRFSPHPARAGNEHRCNTLQRLCRAPQGSAPRAVRHCVEAGYVRQTFLRLYALGQITEAHPSRVETH